MSEALQFGQHPDADAISAFVEQALPAHEREQMLDHLAVCQECRAIVALSLPEVEEPAQRQRVVARKPWWRGWTLAWPVAAAIIAFAFFVVHRYPAVGPNSAGKQVTVARSEAGPTLREQQIAPVAAPTPQSHKAPPPGSMGTGARLSASPTKTEREAPLPAPAIGGQIFAGRNLAAPRQPATAATAPPAGNVMGGAQLTAPTNRDLSSGAAGGVAQASSSIAGIRREGAGASRPEITATQPLEAAVATAPAPAATESVAVSNSALGMETVHSETGSMTINQVEEQAAQLKRPLPSRLQVLSMARQADRVVAIDTDHAVFASKDGGNHWKAIQAPWMGRAVQASLVASPTGGAKFHSIRESLVGSAQPDNAASAQNAAGTLAAQAATPTTGMGSGISGTVTDMSGAIIPGATVTVTNSATGAARTVRTDSAGRYLADELAAGTYRVEAQSPGFNKEEIAAVTVSAAGQTVANLSLTIGAATETVTVQAEGAELSASETARAKSKAGPPAPVFEIVTDNGEHWTSLDGMTWKRM